MHLDDFGEGDGGVLESMINGTRGWSTARGENTGGEEVYVKKQLEHYGNAPYVLDCVAAATRWRVRICVSSWKKTTMINQVCPRSNILVLGSFEIWSWQIT